MKSDGVRLPFKQCKVSGCVTKRVGHGFCSKHYQRYMKYGNPTTVLKPSKKVFIPNDVEFCGIHVNIFIKSLNGEYMKVVLDASDYFLVKDYRWYLHCGYASTTVRDGFSRKSRTVRLHMLLFDYLDTELVVDHKNRDRLDNRRDNLRLVSRSENARNKVLAKDKSSKYLNVNWNKRLRKWVVQITLDGEKRHIGVYDDELVAAEVARSVREEEGLLLLGVDY